MPFSLILSCSLWMVGPSPSRSRASMKLINLVCWSLSSGRVFFYFSNIFLACLTKFLSIVIPSGFTGKLDVSEG